MSERLERAKACVADLWTRQPPGTATTYQVMADFADSECASLAAQLEKAKAACELAISWIADDEIAGDLQKTLSEIE